MANPILPKWMHEGARCVVKINGKDFDAVITRIADYGCIYVKIAIHNPFTNQVIVHQRKEYVSFKHLIRRERYIPELDNEEVSQTA